MPYATLAKAIRDGERGRLEKAINKMWERAVAGDKQAFELLAERGWGRMPQPIVGVDGEPVLIRVDK